MIRWLYEKIMVSKQTNKQVFITVKIIIRGNNPQQRGNKKGCLKELTRLRGMGLVAKQRPQHWHPDRRADCRVVIKLTNNNVGLITANGHPVRPH